MVVEKLDGSLIKVWYNAVVRRWVVSTNGTIDADKYGNSDFWVSFIWIRLGPALRG